MAVSAFVKARARPLFNHSLIVLAGVGLRSVRRQLRNVGVEAFDKSGFAFEGRSLAGDLQRGRDERDVVADVELAESAQLGKEARADAAPAVDQRAFL